MAEAEAKAKKEHWTRRPENKAKLAKMVKRSVAAKKAVRKSGTHKARPPEPPPGPYVSIPEEVFAYALGHVECWIETFAKSAGVPPETLASRLGQVLHGKSRR